MNKGNKLSVEDNNKIKQIYRLARFRIKERKKQKKTKSQIITDIVNDIERLLSNENKIN